MLFRDRTDAGRTLALHVKHLRDTNLVFLGLPRGGVPVAYEVAKELGASLNVIVVRKLTCVANEVICPEIPLVRDRDEDVVELNRQSQSYLMCENNQVLRKGASHLFEEDENLEQVSGLARD